MGDRLTDGKKSEQTVHRTYGDIFDEYFPHYLLMGMSAEQYWDGESSLKKAYRKAYRMRMENEQILADRNNWYMGQYLIRVLQCVPLLVGGLNVKQSTKLPEYPAKPFLEQFAEMKKEEVRQKKEEDQTKLAMALMQATFEKFNRNFEKRKQRQEQEVLGSMNTD